ncbi:hypothetical protein RvY_13358 [Ramazzottius varieornatus]|uniref:Uncharacterized protein n=1 Tax=Ramazzottius varieornatus TaxID=947166 RepID=A0A1D1VRM4_RAMVA|nr:hypothetical protein RvY_13358 [Ramazzottius varieornatus]
MIKQPSTFLVWARDVSSKYTYWPVMVPLIRAGSARGQIDEDTLTFATFVSTNDANNILDAAEKALVSLTLFNILERPLIVLPDAISSFVPARISMTRVRIFLLNQELDFTSVNRLKLPPGEAIAIQVTNGTFSWYDGPQTHPCRHAPYLPNVLVLRPL